MVGTFLRLRWALVKAGFRSGNTAQRIGTAISMLFAVLAGVSGFVAALFVRAIPEPWQTISIQLGLAMIFLGWVLGPITVAGSDSSMDPVKLGLLPLTRRQLASGLTAASVLGPGGLGTAMALLGLVIGLARPSVGMVLVLLGATLFLVLCVLTSRLVLGIVGMGLRKRGVRDVMAVAVPLVVILLSQLPNILQNVARAQGSEATTRQMHLAAHLTRWLPSSFATEMILAGRDARLVRGLLELLGAVVFVVLAGWLWSLLLTRVMTSPPATEGAKGVKQKKSVYAPVLARLHPRARAVAWKDMTLMLREPAQRVQVITVAIFALAAVIAPVLLLRQYPLAAFIVCGMALLLSMSNGNMYGYDGSSHWVNVAAGDDARHDLLGKLVARVLLFLPPLLVLALVSTLVIEPSLVVAVLGITLGASLVGIGLGLVQSVIAPFPVVYSEETLIAKNQGSFLAVVTQFVAFPVLGLAAGPFLWLAMVHHDNVLLASLAGVGAVVVGALVCYGLWRFAIYQSADRQPELLGQISKRAEA